MACAAPSGGDESTASSVPPKPLAFSSPYRGKDVDLVPPVVRDYLNLTSSAKEYHYLKENKGISGDYQNVYFLWKDNDSEKYEVSFSMKSDFSDSVTYESKLTALRSGFSFLPDTTYYVKLKGEKEGDESEVDSFHTLDGPRLIDVSGVGNVRDLGGWAGENGKKIRYEMLYRGRRLNLSGNAPCYDASGKRTLESLNLKYEIDLRTAASDDGNQTSSPLGNVGYQKLTMTQYDLILNDEKSLASIQSFFSLLSSKSSYPIYFHCNSGADRTGTLAFLLEAALGVSKEDCIRDFELTSFCQNSGARWRSKANEDGTDFDASGIYQQDQNNYVAFGKMVDDIVSQFGSEGGSLQEAVTSFLTLKAGVTQDCLAKVKANLLA